MACVEMGLAACSLEVHEAIGVPATQVKCAICLGEYATGEWLCRLPCPSRHAFHQSCIWPWLDSHSTCPFCKFDLLSLAAGAAETGRNTAARTSAPFASVQDDIV
jgi:E3 ubiquitin-protein ligase synoviolin